jgi:type VI secretion system protein ImpJ
MRRLEPVIWTRGTFLTPQYLQIQDRFLEDSLQFNVQALQFRPWGFAHLRIDQEALAAGTLSVSEATGVFPDGLLFDLPKCDTAPPPRPLAANFDGDRNSLDVFLAVPSYRDGGFNVTTPQRNADTRYRAEVEMVRDENSGLAEKPVMVARKNLRLLVEGEAREGYSTLRIATVQKTPAGLYRLHPRFVPPLVNFRASEYLTSTARRLLELLSARSTDLSGVRRQKNQTLADFTSADIAAFWLLYTINSFLPVFRHLFETKGGHPEELFSNMLSLAGALTAFSNKVYPRDLPVYDHDDLSTCFMDLDEKLRFLLETVVPSNFVSLPLKLVRPSIYAASIDRDEYFSNTRMYLAVAADTTQAGLIGRVPQLVKVGSGDTIEHLVQRALPGVPLLHVPNPPSAIPVKLNYEYFSLAAGSPMWQALTRARNIAVYTPEDFPNPQMELLILLPEAN